MYPLATMNVSKPPSSALDADDVQHIAKLARLKVADADIGHVTDDLQKIVAFVNQLDDVDTDGVEPMAHPLGHVAAPLRTDEADTRIDAERIQRDAPDTADGFYRVPTGIE